MQGAGEATTAGTAPPSRGAGLGRSAAAAALGGVLAGRARQVAAELLPAGRLGTGGARPAHFQA